MRFELAGIRIAITSAWRVAAWAAVLVAGRHLLHPAPAITTHAWQWLQDSESIRRELPAILQIVAKATPASYAVSLMRGAWRGDEWIAHDADFAGLAVIFAVCTLVAVRLFRWE